MKQAIQFSWLAIAIPIAVLFGPALVSDRSFAFRDAGHFYYPLFQWCCREWAAGRVPLWNPYESCGVPVLADSTSSVFYPGTLIFLLPLDFAFRYKLYIVAHVILAAAGSYWLARAWKASPPAAALAAIAYACGGNVVFQYSNIVFLVGAAWLPFAALAADRMLRNRSWVAAIALGFVLALMILGGDPQAAYHALLISALYAAILTFSTDVTPSPEGSPHPRSFRTLLVRLGLFCLAAATAYVLAAVQVLPSAEALPFSDRAGFDQPRNIYEAAAAALQSSDQQPFGETPRQSVVRGLFTEPEERWHHELAYDFSIGPWRLIEYFGPNIAGRMFSTHRRWLSLLPAEGRIWTPTLYMGLLPVLFAFNAFRLRAGSARGVWLSAIVLLFTLGSFGVYGLGWLLREIWPTLTRQNPDQLTIGSPVGGVYWLMLTLLPKYVYFRYPAKLLPLVSLAISQLAAIGFDRAAAEPSRRLQRSIFALGCGSAVVAALIWCTGSSTCANLAQRLFTWFIGPTLFATIEWSDPSFGTFDAGGAYHDVLFAFIQAAIVALVGWWLLSKMSSERAQWKLLPVLLTAADVALANSWLIVTAPVDVWRNEPQLAESIRSHRINAVPEADLPPRVFANLATWRPPRFSATESATRPAEIAQWEHDTLFPKYPFTNGIALIESYGSIKSADYESLLSVAKQHGPPQRDKSLLPQPVALRLLGTEFLILPEAHRPDFAERIADGLLSKVDSSVRHAASQAPEASALWQMTRTLPRAWIVHDFDVISELPLPRPKAALDERTREVLFPGGHSRDFFQSAVIETNQPPPRWDPIPIGHATSAFPASVGRCQITHYSPQRVVVEAELGRPGLIVFSDAWYPGWKAFVTSADGRKEVPIYRTNRVLRGVWLPAGKHSVEYEFKSRSFLYGAIISAISWPILAIGLLNWLVIHRRRIQLTNAAHRL